MFDWLFKPAESAHDGCSKEVHVTSSRYGKQTLVVRADLPIDAVDAIRISAGALPDLEPGETREIKVYL